MIKNIAVSTIMVTLVQHIIFVCGQNSSVVTTTSIDASSATAIMPSGTASTSQYLPTSSTLQSATFIPSPTRRQTVTFSITSPTPTNFYMAGSSSLSLSRSSANFSAFPNNSLSSVNFSSYATSSSAAKYSTSPNISSSTTSISFSFKSNISTTAISLSIFKKSSSTFVKSTSLSSSPFHSSSITTSHSSSYSLSATMNSTRLPTSSSTMMAPTTTTFVIATSMLNGETSSVYLSSTTDYSTLSNVHTEPLSQTVSSNPSPLMTSSRDATSLKSTEIATVGLSPPGTPSMKSSELKKTVSSTTKKTASSSSSKMSEKILEFDGKLVVTPLSNENNNHLKKLAASIENMLDMALKAVNGYFYSKVLLITKRENQSKFECTFKLFMRQPSSETAFTLLERIKEYNQTNGFGQFTLNLVETSVPCNKLNKLSTEDRLYLWAIIVIAALGVLCLVFFVAFVYARRQLKKSTKKSSTNEQNSNLRYTDFFPVFDGNDVSQNVPLKLTNVSSTESKQPLKLSDAVDTDSDSNEENGKKSEVASSGENGIKAGKLSVQEPSQSTDVTLHVQDDNDEDETKFSTFSRKR